ncbi:hypothetical protein DOTSEDRAFT_72589 [Dothistroma septosporum NZE10]|uniref:Uncharacterized protein n=1 Tax=Dothistroma septosporum (strain NZE10 / CBS 128990) TaxID=675120 RepID=M2YMN5_DOTSN|nr:hypothetical protein DOTSEDRAFT_72589 [Dothistroma septosporum NZE10]
MAKGTLDWSSPETWQRVVAAIMATGVKVDLKQTATYFGTTYDTLENRFRKLKKEAATLKEEIDKGERSEISTPSRTKSTPSTPRNPKTPKKDLLTTVSNGKITKSTPMPKKDSIKQENVEDGLSFGMGGLTDGNDISFTQDVGFNYVNSLGDDHLEFV